MDNAAKIDSGTDNYAVLDTYPDSLTATDADRTETLDVCSLKIADIFLGLTLVLTLDADFDTCVDSCAATVNPTESVI
jgi:hypothetical protein